MTWNYTALADGLELLDSHSVYTGDAAGLILLTENGIDLSELHLPTEELLYTGWIVSGIVCRQVFGHADGDKFMGRGFAHRANIAQMRAAAKSQTGHSIKA